MVSGQKNSSVKLLTVKWFRRFYIFRQFIILSQQPMHAQAPLANAQLPAGDEAAPAPDYDFSRCHRVKKLATHDLYRFTHEGTNLIVKLFAPEHQKFYQRDVDILRRIQSDRVPRILFNRMATDQLSYEPLERSHMLVMNEAQRGDLNDYMRKIERMGEKMTRTYFRSLVETLQQLHSQQPPILHPNLQPTSLLLTASGNLQVCGWSGQPLKPDSRLQDCIFACGQLALCMLLGHMPFFKKYSATDPYYKLVSSAKFPKFWGQMAKGMLRYDKTFSFSPSFKALIETIFLKKVASFGDILQMAWVREQVYPSGQLATVLDAKQLAMTEKRQTKRLQQQIALQKRKKKMVHGHQLNLGQSRSGGKIEDQEFLKDYDENMINKSELPEVKGRSMSVRIAAQPAMVIAWLKEYLREERGTRSALLKERFTLQNHKVIRTHNYVEIDLCFRLADLEENIEEQSIEPQQDESLLHLKARLSFAREGKEVFAEVEAVQSNFNEYYTNLALKLIEERIGEKKIKVKEE